MEFRKKPVVIEAVQWDGTNTAAIKEFCPGAREELGMLTAIDYLRIPTLEGSHVASVGDWIIRGIKGEYYPCKPDIFAATYEPVQ